MDLKRPSRLLDAANERTSLLIRRRLAGKVRSLGIDAAETKRCRNAAMARAGRALRREAAVRPSERFDRRTGVLEALAKELRGYLESGGALRA